MISQFASVYNLYLPKPVFALLGWRKVALVRSVINMYTIAIEINLILGEASKDDKGKCYKQPR